MTNEQWKAIAENDASYDGRFYYAVTTTGIFCRPSCKSRLPRREHVRVYATVREALSDSFRPCKRCKPDSRYLPEEEWAQRIAELIDRRYAEGITLSMLAEYFYASSFHLQRTFKKVKGMSPLAYLQETRIRAAQRLLITTDLPITSISMQVGVVNAAHFATLFQKKPASGRPHTGINITIVSRKGGVTGMDHQHDTGTATATATAAATGTATRIGYWAHLACEGWELLLASTGTGLCYLQILTHHSQDQEYAMFWKWVERHASEIEWIEDVGRLQPFKEQIAAYLEGKRTAFAIPFDLKGTPFQKKVWQALLEIPHGETRSYSEIAAQLQNPRAVRAVGTAIGANPVLIAVPCHRVMGKNGALTGYRGGLTAKAELLRLEQGGNGQVNSERLI
ncbi:methylated-DNA--[protein]-cysteine S-methyltransferase [Paenibacillus hexagrammi]|uniref:Methylated-DNA--protein-cysteine methyltransferase n=1 Tax=Paenibacillus hexagrammi TaxID=2908839 RepID=A0ABY3SKK4_9BACL|nr:methylated-DNA--[protein]-cysteine S-methyltransferase [Paenibacillus sp. YPD9-1]UJF34003.1 methylated-DNA--[protein]-cysteine S-methyltransferase [Paenibacillus sp. YPD9-1]